MLDRVMQRPPEQMAGTYRRQVSDAMRRGEVLVRVLAACERILRNHLRPLACLSGVMEDRHRRQVPDAPTGALDPQAEVGLLGIEEEALVEEASAEERLATGEHERTRRPV